MEASIIVASIVLGMGASTVTTDDGVHKIPYHGGGGYHEIPVHREKDSNNDCTKFAVMNDDGSTAYYTCRY